MSGLVVNTQSLPRKPDAGAASTGADRWVEAASQSGQVEIVEAILSAETYRRLLDGVFGHSPFLTRCLVLETSCACLVFEQGPRAAFDWTLAELANETDLTSEASLSQGLRIARRRVALTVALADIAGAWSLDDVVRVLSEFADRAIGLTVDFLLKTGADEGAFRLADGETPSNGSGFVVLGMGKLGAYELNYSSDIDLILLFDDERIDTDRPDRLGTVFVRLARRLTRLLEEPTRDGYVFRTDLRLRPDPASTPLAVSLRAAETYYESAGQNWERAALIKARPVAGDQDSGRSFLYYLRPFIWRKNLDFAAIADIHSIKRQINAHRGGQEVAIRGHDVKLGRGGIREIEFFAQTQQLIWGGRDRRVRVSATRDALAALESAGQIDEETRDDLVGAYEFLRRVEHRLQMINDQQTHKLPNDDAGLERIAAFLGVESRGLFEEQLLHHLRNVQRHYAQLFEEAPSLSGPGNLVFTGSDDDPETLKTLAGLGYEDTRSVATVVRGWHHGRYRAMRSARARELLTELMPTVLTAFAQTADPKSALIRFDEFLARLPAGVQVFSLFHANPGLVDLIAEIMGSAPRLARTLSRNPGLLDAVLDHDFFDPLSERSALIADLEDRVANAEHFELALDLCRRWTKDHVFQIGVQILRNRIDPVQSGEALSNIADTNIVVLQPRVESEFEQQHGGFPGGGMTVVGMGKLGSNEMTVTSDLDLIFIYDAAGADLSDGPKPLAPSHYYARLAQRLLNALTVPTAEGPLYEVDMRLRPSGKKGPIASSLEAFHTYQRDQSWTWEQMALTRARPVSGPAPLQARVQEIIKETLVRRRTLGELQTQVVDMRDRIAREHPGESIWDVKYVRGGMIDIEFITQFLQLAYASEDASILSTQTPTALANAATIGRLERDRSKTLIGAFKDLQKVQNLLRVTLDTGFDPKQAPQALKQALAAAVEVVDFKDVEAKLHVHAEAVRNAFREIVGGS